MNMLSTFSRVLILAPHTDDGEFGAGGTIARLVAEGAAVMYVAFSACEESVPAGFDKDILKSEVLKATQVLGISKASVQVLGYKVRRFNELRQDILEEMIRIKRAFDPDLVFQPSMNDVHQDHKVIAEESRRAFKASTVLAYELPWNNYGTDSNCFVAIDESFLSAKIKALSAYRSQAEKPYSNPETIKAWATFRGLQSNSLYAEAFEVIRWYIR